MTDDQPTQAVEVLDRDQAPTPEQIRQLGLHPSPSYMQAIELGHVIAASQLVPTARTAARAAVVIMLGLDMGLSPSAAVTGIHVIEDKDSKVNFVIEGRVLGALVNERPGIAYKVEESSDEKAVLSFWRDGEEVGPKITWDQARAVRAGLWGKGAWNKHPNEMLRWRALGEGVRIYFPEVISGSRIYVEGEIDEPGSVREALEGPQPPPQLADEEAEELRGEALEIWKQINQLNPERMTEGRLVAALRKAGHSHTELRLAVRRLGEGLREEEAFQEAYSALVESFGEQVAKDAAKVAERRGSMPEKVASLRSAYERLTVGAAVQAEPIEEVSDDDE